MRKSFLLIFNQKPLETEQRIRTIQREASLCGLLHLCRLLHCPDIVRVVFINRNLKTMETEIDILVVNQKIAKHKRQIELLESIRTFIQRKQSEEDNILQLPDCFPSLTEKYKNNIETINRCTQRIYKLYEKENSTSND